MRKVKYPLEMSNGEKVTTLEELKENFDIESVVGYFNDGRLLNWLKARYYTEFVDKVSELSKDDPQIHKKLCDIFDVESEIKEIDVEEITRRRERLNKLKQYTFDKEILDRVDLVAFNQEELSDLLDEEKPIIYLCDNTFMIPLSERHKNYIGVSKAIVRIPSNKIVDFDELDIKFKNVIFDEKYSSILKARELLKEKERASEKAAKEAGRPEELFHEGESLIDTDVNAALEKLKESAKLGYAKAYAMIGFLYLEGKYVEQNLEEARKWLKLGMEKDDAESYFWYARTFTDKDENEVSEYDKREAFRAFKRAAELGNSDDDGFSLRWLGACYNHGIGTDINIKKAVECYQKAVDLGNSIAAYELADMYFIGEDVNEDPYKAYFYYNKAVDLDEHNQRALEMLAYCYYEGYSIEEDYDKAFELYSKAAEEGDIESTSMCNLGKLFYIVKNDKNKAFYWMEKSANAGDAEAMRRLGVLYRDGIGTQENIAKAIQWYTAAVENGDKEALCHLGYIYLNGNGVAQDYQKAAFYFKQAADNGDADAMDEIGLLYDWGRGVAEDEKLAFQWYLRAAEAGSTSGMAHVGRQYYIGRGTKTNKSEARRWIEKSATSGNAMGMVYFGDYYYDSDYPQAVDWYQRAADEGFGEAAYKLYKIYKDGKCKKSKNPNEARHWELRYKELGYDPKNDPNNSSCFITTAVCDSFGKADDCYELTAFRNFRDNWLALQNDGKNLIAEYYQIAPQIVSKIDNLKNSAQIYKNIWTKYLAPCLNFIENGDNQSCKNLYIEMVNSLKKKFLADKTL